MRTIQRAMARAKFDWQIKKERAIGVDPIFLHGDTSRRMAMRPAWKKASAEYDKKHPLNKAKAKLKKEV